MTKTIACIATPIGVGAISIIRLSGSEALTIADRCFKNSKLPSLRQAEPNKLYLGTFICDGFCEQCLTVYFKAPFSYTGEDVIEFQCHGGARISEEVLKTLLKLGAVIAGKGDFTRRAFLNGKLSLSEAEGVADMISSENTASLNAGYRLLTGSLNTEVKTILSQLLDITATLEASLDYPIELEDEARESLPFSLDPIFKKLKSLLNTSSCGHYIKNGISVAIIGAPNVGKSSLLNAILGVKRSIVTDIAGTTRDCIEERVERQGVYINFIDTAGLRNTSDIVERMGVDITYEKASAADVILFLLDSSKPQTEEELQLLLTFQHKRVIKVYNKSDLGILPHCSDGIVISAKDNQNLDVLLDKILSFVISEKLDGSGNILTNLRHVSAIAEAVILIDSVISAPISTPTECYLIDLKSAYLKLGEITGDTASEDVIDKIFSKFCLGK